MLSAICAGSIAAFPTFAWNVFLSFVLIFTDLRSRSTIGWISVPCGMGIGILIISLVPEPALFYSITLSYFFTHYNQFLGDFGLPFQADFIQNTGLLLGFWVGVLLLSTFHAYRATDKERDIFIEAFWKQRDPDPLTPENEFKIEHYKRLAYANQFLGKVSDTHTVMCHHFHLLVDDLKGFHEGQRAVVLVRPETIQVQPDPPERKDWNIIPGEVETITFHGAVTRLGVNIHGQRVAADITVAHTKSIGMTELWFASVRVPFL
jgi:hypothetical protein